MRYLPLTAEDRRQMLAAIGARFEADGHPRNLTTLHPIAAGDMYGVMGVDHIARDGCLSTIIAGSYPSGPSSLPMPEIWRPRPRSGCRPTAGD